MPSRPRRTSGLAITSFILGLLSLFCFSVLTGIPALVLAIVSLGQIKRSPATLSGRGLAIAGLVLSLISTVLFIALMGYTYTLRPKPFTASAPAYTTLIGEGYSGRGFHFEHRGKTYVACSLHQFDNMQPSLMLSDLFDNPVTITGQIHVQTDLQVLRYRSTDLDVLTPLPYSPDPIISIGDPVFLLDDDIAIKGHVTRRDTFDDQWIFEPEKGTTFEAQARSGSPIISGLTGQVIGVFLTADDPDQATWGGFESLQFP